MAIYFLTYHCQPNLEFDNSDDIGGAYVNCWIKAIDIEDADEIAGDIIKKKSWFILTLEDKYEVNEIDYSENSKGKEYYNQAIIDGTVLVFHTYPLDEG